MLDNRLFIVEASMQNGDQDSILCSLTLSVIDGHKSMQHQIPKQSVVIPQLLLIVQTSHSE
jgi:hypothetical protein